MVSKFVRHRLSLSCSCLGASAKVSTTWLTTWCTFLAIIVVHLGSFVDATLVVMATLCSINWLTARFLAAVRNTMFSMVTFVLESRRSTSELLVLKPITSQCSAKATWQTAKDALSGTLSLTLSQCYLAIVSFFNLKMSNVEMKGHNNGVALSAIMEFFKP